EVNLLRLPLRAWIQGRIDKGATLTEACRARFEHEAAKEANKNAAEEAEQAANAAAWEFFHAERDKARQGLPSVIKLGQDSFQHGGKWGICSHKWTLRDRALAANVDPMEYFQDEGAAPADLDADLDTERRAYDYERRLRRRLYDESD